MKLILTSSLIWMLLSTAEALQCCTDTQCLNTTLETCTAETSCLTGVVQGSAPTGTAEENIQRCAPDVVCPSNGLYTFSLSTTSLTASGTFKCCNADKCNSEPVSLPGAQQANALRCFSCDFADSNCSKKIQCEGVEDRCFRVNANVGTITNSLTLGCASANLCAAASNITLPVVGPVANVTCCGTNLCNSARAAATSTFALLLGFLVFMRY